MAYDAPCGGIGRYAASCGAVAGTRYVSMRGLPPPVGSRVSSYQPLFVPRGNRAAVPPRSPMAERTFAH
eukprot:1867566-Prymnesium_polylepis.1